MSAELLSTSKNIATIRFSGRLKYSELAAAQKQIAECSTDLCVVNGPAYGEGFGLVGGKGAPGHLPNPPVLFDALEKFTRAGV